MARAWFLGKYSDDIFIPHFVISFHSNLMAEADVRFQLRYLDHQKGTPLNLNVNQQEVYQHHFNTGS